MITKHGAILTWNDAFRHINICLKYMQNIDVITQAFISQYMFDFIWLAAAVIKNACSRRISSSERS